MKTKTKAQVQKARRRERVKNEIAKHKAMKGTSAFESGRNKLIKTLVDIVSNSKVYPKYQATFILGQNF